MLQTVAGPCHREQVSAWWEVPVWGGGEPVVGRGSWEAPTLALSIFLVSASWGCAEGRLCGPQQRWGLGTWAS